MNDNVEWLLQKAQAKEDKANEKKKKEEEKKELYDREAPLRKAMGIADGEATPVLKLIREWVIDKGLHINPHLKRKELIDKILEHLLDPPINDENVDGENDPTEQVEIDDPDLISDDDDDCSSSSSDSSSNSSSD